MEVFTGLLNTIFFFLAFAILLFNWQRVIFLVLALEVLFVAVFFVVLFEGSGMPLLLFLGVSVLGSVTSLLLLVSLVKSSGTDLVNF